MPVLNLELYYELDEDRRVAEDCAGCLRAVVANLVSDVQLRITVLRAPAVERATFRSHGKDRNVPAVRPSGATAQSLLLTHEDIESEGWGWPRSGCISIEKMRAKATAGGAPVDIVLHEWIHTLAGLELNGRVVPSPDLSADYGFGAPSGIGADGVPTWYTWYRRCLGG